VPTLLASQTLKLPASKRKGELGLVAYVSSWLYETVPPVGPASTKAWINRAWGCYANTPHLTS